MKKLEHLLHSYTTPKHLKVALALLTLVTFALAGGAPNDGSGNG